MLRGITNKPIDEDVFGIVLREIGVDTSKFRLHLLLDELSNGDEISRQDADYIYMLDNVADRVLIASLQLAEARLTRNNTLVTKARSKHSAALNEYAGAFAAQADPNGFKRRVDEARAMYRTERTGAKQTSP